MTTTTPITDCAKAVSATVFDAAAADERICMVNNDSAETHSAVEFQQRFPDRFIDVGIAEQNLVGVSIGLANGGLVPLVYSAGCFLSARALEQIKNAAYTGANVKFFGFVSGFSYGALGGTHHAIEDIAWLRAIPGMTVLVPGSPADAEAATRAALAHDGPVYVRVISKETVPELFEPDHEFTIGRARQLRDGTDVTFVGTGLMTGRLLAAAEALAARGVRARVLHCGSVSPIDVDAIAAAARDTGRLVVAEDHVVNGGFGGAVSEVLVRTVPVPMLHIGVPQEFAPVGPSDFIYEHFGLTAAGLTDRIASWLGVG